jgi:hypothetical protein
VRIFHVDDWKKLEDRTYLAAFLASEGSRIYYWPGY